MRVAVGEIGRLIGPHWRGLVEAGGVAGVLSVLGVRARARAAEWRRELRRNEEMQAYARLDVRLAAGDWVGGLAERVSVLMAEKSAFRRTAMVVRDGQGGFSVAGRAGVEDSTVDALNAWAKRVLVSAEREDGVGVRRNDGTLGTRLGSNSFTVILGKRVVEGEYRRAIVIPLWTTGGRVLGALAVGADGFVSVRRSVLEEALRPLEALAIKVARSLENAAVAERLMRAERLAGLGLMAGGMAHALSNPLTAVLGFAELIAGSAGETRVREDAEVIVREVLRMRETVETLLDLSRPVSRSDRLVDLVELVRELAAACAETLEKRGVRLDLRMASDEAEVRGNRHRMRLMLEHLLNNSAQALAGVSVAPGEDRVIRVSVSAIGDVLAGEERRVHLIVSDTGPGFRRPERVFGLFGAMEEGGDGAGMGLSICYGIVHEMGGEIRAFNMHPHGAAVSVELPAVEVAARKIPGCVREPAAGVTD